MWTRSEKQAAPTADDTQHTIWNRQKNLTEDESEHMGLFQQYKFIIHNPWFVHGEIGEQLTHKKIKTSQVNQ